MKRVVCMVHCCFVPLTMGLFFFVGGAQLFSAAGFVGSAESLAVQKSVSDIPYWLLMAWEGAAVFCWLGKTRLTRVYSLFWLTLALLLYWIMHWFLLRGGTRSVRAGRFFGFCGNWQGKRRGRGDVHFGVCVGR